MRKSFLLFLSVICVIAFSCSDSDDGDDTGDGILSGLTLTSDRSYFSAGCCSFYREGQYRERCKYTVCVQGQ